LSDDIVCSPTQSGQIKRLLALTVMAEEETVEALSLNFCFRSFAEFGEVPPSRSLYFTINGFIC